MTATAHSSRNSGDEKALAEVHVAIHKLTGEETESVRTRHARPSFTRILVCHDGTTASLHAIEWAAHLAQGNEAHVVVASIVPPDRVANAPWALAYAAPIMSDHRVIVAKMREFCDDAAAILRSKGVDAESISTEGDPARQISEIARTHHSDLVILGAKGSGSVSRVLLGSTAESVMGRVEASVLVVRTPPRAERVLVATDGSAASHQAVAHALRYAGRKHAEVTVQHVLDAHEDAQSLPSEGLLKSVIEKLELPTPPHVTYVLDAGRPARKIVERAKRENADLIVLGARGLGRISGALLGSVSHRVANAAHTNVLVVREKE